VELRFEVTFELQDIKIVDTLGGKHQRISLIEETLRSSNCTRETKRGLELKAIIRVLDNTLVNSARHVSGNRTLQLAP